MPFLQGVGRVLLRRVLPVGGLVWVGAEVSLGSAGGGGVELSAGW
jgi:hypothetical protein